MTQLDIKKRMTNRFPKEEGLSSLFVHALFSPSLEDTNNYKECQFFALPIIHKEDERLPTTMRFFAAQLHRFIFPKIELTVRTLNENALALTLATSAHRPNGCQMLVLRQEIPKRTLLDLQVDKVGVRGTVVKSSYEDAAGSNLNNSALVYCSSLSSFKSRSNQKTVEAINARMRRMFEIGMSFFNKSDLHPSFRTSKHIGRALYLHRTDNWSAIEKETRGLPLLSLNFIYPAGLTDPKDDRSFPALMKRFTNA